MVTNTTTRATTGLSVVLRVLILALLMALAVPALAMADDAPAGILDPPTLEAPSPAAEAPPADPSPAQTTPAAEDTSAGQPPVVAPEPTAPPATTTPDPVAEAPAEPATPPEAEVVPVPAPVTPPDVIVTTPELVATPAVGPDDAAAKLLPVVVIPPANADAPSRSADAPPSLPGGVLSAATLVSSITLAAATDTPVTVAADPTGSGPAPPASMVSGLLTQDAALHQNLFTLDPEQGRSPVAPVGATTIERGPGMPFGEESGSALFSESVAAPIGTVGSGSSLLAVLAGYVLPGVGGPPASTLVMFILVGLIVAIARAPRPQLSERAHDGTLLGAACGHGLAVCRPG